MRRGQPRARARLICDGDGCNAEIVATGQSLADANENLKAALHDAGWVAHDLDATLEQAEEMMEVQIEAARHPSDTPRRSLAMHRVDVPRQDLCPRCQAKAWCQDRAKAFA